MIKWLKGNLNIIILLCMLVSLLLPFISIMPAQAVTVYNLTRQVGQSSDDCSRITENDSWSTAGADLSVGYYIATAKGLGGAFRFTNITIPPGSTVTVAYIVFTCDFATANVNVNTRFRAEDVDDAATFSTQVNFDGRSWTTASVNWDSIAAWVLDGVYQSPDLKTILQEVVDRAGWVSGNDIVVEWDDWEKRSTQVNGTYRDYYPYDDTPAKSPKLYLSYTLEAPTVVSTNYTVISESSTSIVGTLSDIGGYSDVYCFFQYGLTAGYGTNTSEVHKTATGTFSELLTSLTPVTTYHFRSVGRYDTGEYVFGADKTFDTSSYADWYGAYAYRQKVFVDGTGSAKTNYPISWTFKKGSPSGGSSTYTYQGLLDAAPWQAAASNPVIPLGPSGSWDSVHTYGGTILPDLANPNRLIMFYDGAYYIGGTMYIQTGVAYANKDDPLHWTKYAGNPVLAVRSGTWESRYCIISDVVIVNNEYWAYYEGMPTTSTTPAIGMAYSTDGISWTRDTRNPIINPGWAQYPKINRVGATWYMYWAGSGNSVINYSTSNDGKSWTGSTTMISGSTDAYTPSTIVEVCEVIGPLSDGKYIATVESYGNPGVTYPVVETLYYSTSPTGPWSPSATNPYWTGSGVSGTWDRKHVFIDHIYYADWTDYKWLIVYSGSSWDEHTGSPWQIGIKVANTGSASDIVYLYDHTLNWPYDIRVTSSDAVTLQSYYRSAYTANEASLTVKLASLSADGDYFYVYYGYAAGGDVSSVAGMYTYTNDGTTLVGWTAVNAVGTTTWSVDAGTLKATATGTENGSNLWFDTQVSGDFRMQFDVITQIGLSANNYEQAVGVGTAQGGTQYTGGWSDYFTEDAYFISLPGGVSYSSKYTSFDTSAAWHTYLLEKSGTTWNLYMDGVLKVTRTETYAQTYVSLYSRIRNSGEWAKYDNIYISTTSGLPATSYTWYPEEGITPTITTSDAEDIEATSAVLHGIIDSAGQSSVNLFGFDYGTTTAYGSTVWSENGTFVPGPYYIAVTGLTASTTYHFRMKAHNTQGWGYGRDNTLTTTGVGVLTNDAANVLQTSVTLQGTITAMGGYSTVYAYFEWGLSTGYGTYTSEQAKTTTGSVTQDLTGLTAGQTYHYRAVIRYTTVSKVYGSDKSFTTGVASPGAPVNFKAESTADSIVLTWTGGAGSAGTLIRYATDTYPVTRSEGILLYSGVDSTCTLTGLTSGLTYYFSAWGYSGSVYSTNKATTSGKLGLPGELEPPNTFGVEDVKVYKDYLETGDVLFVGVYKILYVSVPAEDVREYVKIYVSDNTTLKAQNVPSAWGYRPYCIYQSSGHSLSWGHDYDIIMEGRADKWSSPPEASYTLSSRSWIGSDLDSLQQWVLDSADRVGMYYNVDLTQYVVSRGRILNDTGAEMYEKAIPGLREKIPELFAMTPAHIESPEEKGPMTYTGETMEDAWGTYIHQNLDSLGAFAGLSGQSVGAVVWGLMLLMVAGGIGSVTTPTVGALCALPLLFAGAFLSFIPMDVAIGLSIVFVVVGLYIWFVGGR